MQLDTVNVKRLYLQVAEQLAALIQSGEVKAGDRLPSERDLAVRFSVSRPTIREAMITLEVMGLVEVRSGSGVYVRESEGHHLELPEDLPGPFEILEARKVLESEVAALAASRINNDQLVQLKTLLQQMDSPTQSAADAEVADQQFHLLIAEASLNSALVNSVKWLWELRNNSEISAMFHDHARETGSRPSVDEHRAILAALMQRDANAARQAMSQHLKRVIENLTERSLG
jgi:DNA-binding FadR family transcriptional regulator